MAPIDFPSVETLGYFHEMAVRGGHCNRAADCADCAGG
jgi:hypothetical protein